MEPIQLVGSALNGTVIDFEIDATGRQIDVVRILCVDDNCPGRTALPVQGPPKP